MRHDYHSWRGLAEMLSMLNVPSQVTPFDSAKAKKIRESKGLTQTQLAKQLGIGVSTLGRIERGSVADSVSPQALGYYHFLAENGYDYCGFNSQIV